MRWTLGNKSSIRTLAGGAADALDLALWPRQALRLKTDRMARATLIGGTGEAVHVGGQFEGVFLLSSNDGMARLQ